MRTFNSNTPEGSRSLVTIGGSAVVADRRSGDWRAVLSAFIVSLDKKSTTRATYKKALVQYFKWVESSGRSLASMTREDILSFKDYLLDPARRRSELTVALYVTAVRRFYQWTEGEKVYPNIARDISNPRKNKKAFKKMHLTDEQGAAYLDAFLAEESNREEAISEGRRLQFRNLHRESLRDYAIATLMLYCGLRTIEVHRLDVGDITFRAGKRVVLVQGKGHDAKDAYVLLIDEAWGPVKEYLATRPHALDTEPLFVCEGYGSEGRRLSAKRIQAISKDGFRRIGLDGHAYSAHSLRHTTGVMIVKNGGSLLDVQTVLRHESPATSEIYLRSAMEEIRLQNAPESRLSHCFGRGEQVRTA